MNIELSLTKAIANDMVAHCMAGRPNEACGILAAKDGEIVKAIAMTNVSPTPETRYVFASHEQHAMYKELHAQRWDLGAVYHSHTHTEAYPSPTDVREAHEEVPYVIVSLAEEPPSIRAFMIHKANWADEKGDVVEIPVRVVG